MKGRGTPGRFARALLLTGALASAVGCGRSPADAAPSQPPLFELLAPAATGVSFQNTLPESPDFNILNYLYYYNGGGVAVGDVNGDSLPDLYFSSNLEPNRLYLNKGSFRFEDATESAGVSGPPGWKTGVAMADVDGDGDLDLYVSAVRYLSMAGRNILYINDGAGHFTDRTAEFGVGHEGYSTQAAFLDYDMDGDLDLYLLNHSTQTERAVGSPALRTIPHPTAGDRLFRNDGGRFTDVSAKAGIYQGVEGFGLGVVASDVNMDGCPDLYIANDFQENDYLYLNNCNGTFTESIARATRHTSRFSMGVDAGDIDNDARPDLAVLDMLPEREDVLKTSASSEGFNLFDLRVRAGYWPQYARNTLQLNRGGGRFSEIGYLAGVQATDWSWSALLADFDDDGRKDLFITNGIYRRPNDLDYINYVGNQAMQASLARGISKENLALLDSMPRIALSNYLFRNEGRYRFTDVADRWGLSQPGFSNGAAYVDLDNDGALDLVVNNIAAPASIYRNRARELTKHHWLAVTLHGEGKNTAGVGAKVLATAGGTTQLVEQVPTRGWLSSMDPRLHFGFGDTEQGDSLVVIWPDRRMQVVKPLPLDRHLTLHQRDATLRWAPAAPPSSPLFADVSSELGPPVRHVENDFLDYNREPLMPHRLSTEGPALAVADVDGDGLDDVYVGGAKWQAGTLLVQRPDGSFRARPQPAIAADSLDEDVDAAFLDADGDGDQDLVVVSGGNEFWGDAEALESRLYRNDGKGTFTRDVNALPSIRENGGCVLVGDFDGDGDPDLFLGARVVSREYGRIPTSHLLQNDGSGRFADVTATLAPALVHAGMVSSGAWLDYDGDGKLDLVVAGEWMAVRLFRQEGGHFVERSTEAGLASTEGWWNSVTVADLNGDARPDLVLGNLGLNSYVHASPSEPARLYVGDFFNTGSLKQLLTFYKHGTSYPVAGRDDLVKLMPALRQKYPSFTSFGAATIEQIFPPAELSKATVLEARMLASAVAIANGKGFAVTTLPAEAQFFPVYGAVARDFDGDGTVDLLLGGNFNGVTPVYGRYDAGYGLFLRGDGGGTFTPVDMAQSGVAIDGEVRDLKLVRGPGGRSSVAVARNNDTVLLLRSKEAAVAAAARAPRAVQSR
ncbi:MAG: VCBS repeat-containing protein [Gemmatimonadaceae bacterium]|nr:VCBS repeat-containing protein [Gemmatimonadaceae bacterium]